MEDAKATFSALEKVYTEISRVRVALQKEKSALLGYEISTADLTGQLKNPKLTTAERKAKHEAFQTEDVKIQETIAAIAVEEKNLLKLVEGKREMEQILDATGHKRQEFEGARGAPQGVQGSQIASIPSFDGAPGTDGEKWIRMIDRFKINFSWTSRQTAQTIRNKLTGEAALFVDNQDDEGILGTDNWDDAGQPNLREMLMNKFAITLSAATASHAIDDLTQGVQELVDPFYERVRYAVTKFLHGFNRTTRGEKDAYSRIYQRLVFNLFKTGLHTLYRQQIFSGPTVSQPKTAVNLLEAARNAELEAGKTKKVSVLSATSQEEEPTESPGPTAEPQRAAELSLESLTKEIVALRKAMPQRGRGRFRGRSRGRGGRPRGPIGGQGQGCFICGALDHWSRYCPQRDQAPRGRGGFRPQMRNQRGNRGWQMNEMYFDNNQTPEVGATYEDNGPRYDHLNYQGET